MFPSSNQLVCGDSVTNLGHLFDTRRKALHQDHKLATADLSQVCDGRNWELFRHAVDRTCVTKTTARDLADESIGGSAVGKQTKSSYDATADDAKSRLKSTYMPISSRNARSVTPPQREQQQLHPDDEQAPRPSLGDALAPVDAQGQGNPQDQDDMQSPRKIRRRPSSKNRHGRRRASSSSAPRRHSDDDRVPNMNRLTTSANGPLGRLSLDSDTTSDSTTSGRPLVTVRDLSEPKHRCSHTNRNVSGIMRRARYSSNDLAAMAKSDQSNAVVADAPKPAHGGVSQERFLGSKIVPHSADRRFSPLAGIAMTPDLGLSSELDLPISRSVSAGSLTGLSKASKHHNSMIKHGIDDADWVASGVDFSKSMEVYLFQT